MGSFIGESETMVPIRIHPTPQTSYNEIKDAILLASWTEEHKKVLERNLYGEIQVRNELSLDFVLRFFHSTQRTIRFIALPPPGPTTQIHFVAITEVLHPVWIKSQFEQLLFYAETCAES